MVGDLVALTWLSLRLEGVDIHRRVDVRADLGDAAAAVFVTRVDAAVHPVRPVERVRVEGDSERVRQLSLH